MTCNNVILAQPEAGASINYNIPEGESARLSFGPGDIDGLSLTENGGLHISFTDGGSLTIGNFQSLIDNGNLLYLSDGTMVDPKLLQAGLGSQIMADAANDNDVVIGLPEAGITREITLEPGSHYAFDFELTAPQKAYQQDGQFIMTFDNGGKIVLTNYAEAMDAVNPPELRMESKVCKVTGADLITALTDITEGVVVPQTVATVEEIKEEEVAQKTAHKSEVQEAKLNDIAPAAGDDMANKLAQIEPAAGEAQGPVSSGYGFNSQPGSEPLNGIPAIGPLGATALNYNAPEYDPESLLIKEPEGPTDDHPILTSPPSNVLDETNLGPLVGQGTVFADFGNDTPGTITPNGNYNVGGSVKGGVLSSCGDQVVITETANGYKGEANGQTVFTLVVNPDTGNYTYTQYIAFDHADPNDPNDAIVLTFGVTATDHDGDTADTVIKITVKDDAPIAHDDVDTAIEDQTITGNVLTNDTFSNDDHNTVIKVSFNGTDYNVPAVGFVTVPGQYGTLKLYANGDYSYTANHNNPDGTDTFTYTLQDCDLDTDPAKLSIRVSPIDDNPVLVQPETWTIDETNLGPINLSGDLNADFFGDTPGSFMGTGTFTSTGSKTGGILAHNGTPVNVTFDANTGVYTGTAGGTTIFTLTVQSNGDYSFTLFENIDHADGTDPNDIIELNFGVKAVDSDGDSDTGVINIKVKDDVPEIKTDFTQVDETNLSGGPLVVNDVIPHDFGEDGPGSIEANGDFVAMYEMGGQNSTLTSCGVAVVVTHTTSGYVGKAGGTTVFELVIDPLTGEYTYTQFEAIDHPDGNDPDDVIWLKFGVEIIDYDGDTDTAYIGIDVHDDAPHISDAQSTVDETDLSPTTSVNGTVAPDFGADGPGEAEGTGSFASSGSKLGGNLTSGGVAVNVAFDANTDTYTGTAGGNTVFTLVIHDDGTYTFTLFDTLDHADPNDPNDIINLDFGVQITDCDGDSDEGTIRIRVKDDVPVIGDSAGQVDETNLDNGPLVYSDTVDTNFGQELGSVAPAGGFEACEMPGGTPLALTSGGAAVVVTETANGYVGKVGGTTIFTITINATTGQYTYTQFEELDHPNSNDPDDVIRLKFPIEVESIDGDSDTGLITIDVADDGPVAVNDINGAEEDQLITGNVVANDDLSEDHPNTVTKVVFKGTTYNVPDGGSVVVDADFGKLTMHSDGTYSYQADDNNPDGTDVFTYCLTDDDGDTDDATLSIRVTPDGDPVAVSEFLAVDETNLTPGPMIFNGNVNPDFGADGAGTLTPNGNVTTGGSLLGGTFTSGGVPIVITQTANGYVGKAGGTTIFTLTIQNNGDYTFQLFEHVDHADATDPNDIIVLNFGVTIADADGDEADGQITIHIHDDAPVAYDDGTKAVNEDQTVTGNVTTNDEKSEDQPNHVVQVIFNGTPHNVPLVGTVNVAGTYGVLTISSTGAYSYKANHNNPDGTDTFTYVLEDYDGDKDTAEFSFRVSPINDEPILVQPESWTIDETNLGPIVRSGDLNADFGNDGPGSFMGTGTFNSTGSKTGGILAHNGTPINVTFDANTGIYTGKAGGTTIFTLKVQANGDYTFTLFDNLDHADGNNPNDIIELNFGVKAVDSDGDTDTGVINIKVKDDVPEIKTDFTQVDETNLKHGPLMVTDTIVHDFGEDGPGDIKVNGDFVAMYQMNGQNSTLSHCGTPIVVTQTANGYIGKAGNETIFEITVNAQTGQYTYKQYETLDHPDGSNPDDVIWLKFGVTITDYDGDTDTAYIGIDVHDDGPVANDDMFCVTSGEGRDDTPVIDGKGVVDETGGFDMITGQANVDYFGDGPGTVMGTGTFSSSYALTSCGVAVSVTLNGNTYTGKAGGQTIFTLVVNADGSYKFTQYDQLDHALGGSNHNDLMELNFGVKATDSDGDVGTGNIKICVYDDGPVAHNDWLGSYIYTGDDVRSTTLSGNLITGTGGGGNAAYYPWGISGLQADTVGADAPGTITAFTFEGLTATIPAGGSATISANVWDWGDSNLQISPTLGGSHTGDDLVITVYSDGRYYITGAEKWPGHVGEFTYTLMDCDGDTSTAKAGWYSYITPLVLDLDGDGVELVNANQGVYFDMNVDGHVLDKTAWAGPDDGLLAFDANNDGRITDRSELFGNTNGYTDGFDKLADFDTNHDGKITAADANFSKLLVWKDANTDGVSQESELLTLSQLGITSINLNAASVNYQINGQDIILQSTFTMNGQTRTIVDALFDVENGDDLAGPNANPNLNGVSSTNTIHASVLHNDTLSQDDPNHVTAVIFGGTTYNIAIDGSVTVNGQYGKLVMNSDGSFTYTAKDDVQGDPTDVFTYVLTDKDGDSDTAQLKLCVKEGPDDQPVVVKAFNQVDETGGFDTVSGTVNVDYGNDGPGTMMGTGTFSSTYALKSCGDAVSVSLNGNIYTGTAGGRTIFTLTVNSNGTYTFKQLDQLDHANPNDPNDSVDLNFGVKATDSDGDVGTGQICIRVFDDGPHAVDDGMKSLGQTGDKVSGNVLSNDTYGQDLPGSGVLAVVYGGHTYNIASGSSVTVNTPFGNLIINSNGNWTFDRDNPTVTTTTEHVSVLVGSGEDSHYETGTKTTTTTTWEGGTANFSYVIADKDGDKSTATFSVKGDPYSKMDMTYVPDTTPGDGGGDGDGGDGCPLVFDLDHDGIELLSKDHGVSFDIDEDGVADKTAWLGGDDAFLVWDKNEDGLVNDHSEMFGNDTIGGFEVLASYDSNQDGVIDANDDIWSNLQLWQDLNGDGVTQAGEMYTLDQAGFVSISLSTTDYNQTIEGNFVGQTGQVTLADGSIIDGYDAWFQFDQGHNVVEVAGGENVYGTDGADAFIFKAIQDSAATVVDFHADEGDVLDVSQLLEGHDDVTEAINNFVYATQTDGGTIISVDTTGSGDVANAVEVAKVEGLTEDDVAAMIAKGSLIV